MAKGFEAPKKEEVKKYPSSFGSHKVMVDDNLTSKLIKDTTVMVVCRDDVGVYITEKARLDNGLSDTYRFTSEEFRKTLRDQYLPLDVDLSIPKVEDPPK